MRFFFFLTVHQVRQLNNPTGALESQLATLVSLLDNTELLEEY
jgi:hypothetical protein